MYKLAKRNGTKSLEISSNVGATAVNN